VKLREVFRYELAHRLRNPSTWVYAAILFAIAFAQVRASGDLGAAAVHVNAPVRLAGLALLASLVGMLVTAALFGDAAIRDVRSGMDALLYTSAVRKAEYLGGRYLAALTTNAVVLVAVPLGQAAVTLLGHLDAAMFGPFRVAAYLQPWLLFLLPNMALFGAIMFTVGVLSRQLIPVYLIGAVSLIAFLGAVSLGLTEAGGDPLALGALFTMTRYWTAAEQNTRLIGFPAGLLWNRVVWLAVAGAVLALLHYRFRFAHPDGGGRNRREEIVVAPDFAPVVVPTAARAFGFRTALRQTLAIARNSLAEIMASRWFVVVLLMCAGLMVLWGWNVADSVFDMSTWPVTLLMGEVLMGGRAEPLFYVLIAVFAGELVWKDREVSASEIADAMPVAEGAALLGRFLALVAMLVMFLAASIVGCILVQALQGYYNFEIGLYLRIVFGLNLADYVLFAVLAMTIHVVVNHKYLGHIVALSAFAFTAAAWPLGIRHHLLVYNGRPGWAYSDMNGFGPYVEPILWFKLYWAAWALLLAVVACVLWVRGREPGVRRRLRQARARFTGPAARMAGAAAVLIVATGGFVFYNTNVLNEYVTADEQGAAQADYEKRYGRFEDVPQPTIESAELRVEIYPDEQAVDLRGSYRLVNHTDAPIDSVHVSVGPAIDTRSISFDRAAQSEVTDEDVGYRIYALDRALNPGEAMQLSFDVAFRQRGFSNDDPQTDVVSNGAYFNRTWLPFIGYQPVFELTDEETRERHGLARRPPPPGPDAVAARGYTAFRNEDKVQVEMTLGTSPDQVAITPGVLHREWTENGRRYFHYETEMPTSFGATVLSGRYAVQEDRWNDVALGVFYHPKHDYNVDRFVRSMKASLEYYSAQFGPYPDKQLRLVEIPRYGRFGRAHPHTIVFTEDLFFSRVKDGQIDAVFFGMAHEVAHQWWGGQIRTARGFLSESLANYSALMVTEKTFGPEVARRVYAFQMEHYFTGRAARANEVPLLEIDDQAYIMYRKGVLAMYLMRDYIGDEAVNTALRRFLDKHRAGGPPYPTALDVTAELRAVTPDSLQYLITDLFETVTLWDVSTKRVIVERMGTGEYAVTLDVVAKKIRADRVGSETEVPMDDLVEIGVFAPGEGDGSPLYIQRHRIRSGEQTIRITVQEEPARAGIDPLHKLIDREGGDNVVEAKTVGADTVR
jgi:ABC-2 type transport system permease protein